MATSRNLSLFLSQMSVEGKVPKTIMLYKNTVNDFLDYTNGYTTEAHAIKYLENLKVSGYSPAYIRTTYYVLKRWFTFRKASFTIRPPKKPEPEEQFTPVLSVAQVNKLVSRARDKCTDQELARLALSTTYGIRREENLRVSKEHINKKEGTIKILTAKGGRTRIHLIPSEIKKYVVDYPWSPCNASWCSRVFKMMVSKCNMEEEFIGMGYHSIRRGLITELQRTELKETVVENFLRWKVTGKMLSIYTKFPDNEVDKMVFKVHPFLDIWR